MTAGLDMAALRALADDSAAGWARLAAAADLERVVHSAEQDVDAAMGWEVGRGR